MTLWQIVFAYPAQYSNILKDFIINNHDLWKGKKIFIIAMMGLFSGDGAGILARLFERNGAVIIGGLHLKMPDSICDERGLKRSLDNNKRIVANAEKKDKRSCKGFEKWKIFTREYRTFLSFSWIIWTKY